ncbi:hypothetical protein EV363DRAFT_1175645, partial [Boletus edulis]
SSDRVGLVTRSRTVGRVPRCGRAELASRVWEGNGFDYAEGYLGNVLDFLGYENAYMRMGSAIAIVGAVEYRPLLYLEEVKQRQVLFAYGSSLDPFLLGQYVRPYLVLVR